MGHSGEGGGGSDSFGGYQWGEHDGYDWPSSDDGPYNPKPTKWRWDAQTLKWRRPWYTVALDLVEPLILVLVVGGLIALMVLPFVMY